MRREAPEPKPSLLHASGAPKQCGSQPEEVLGQLKGLRPEGDEDFESILVSLSSINDPVRCGKQ